jgi:hypothetical protein
MVDDRAAVAAIANLVVTFSYENHRTKVNRAKLASSGGGNIRFAQNRASSPLALFNCH